MFFDEVKDHSSIKKNLVVKYFKAWSIIMKSRSNKLGYIDLFAGPGKYKDGTESTPIAIMKLILNNNSYRNKFVTIFNDKNKAYINDLKSEINQLKNIDLLKYKPTFLNLEIDFKISDFFSDKTIIPSLIFIDPWGYKGVTQNLIYSLTKDWGCDTILFFNYNRICPGINNSKVTDHMKNLFGEKRYINLYKTIKENHKINKENLIINEFSEAIQEKGIEYVLPFRFESKRKQYTSHYIIFLSKSFTGFNIMRDIMAKESSNKIQGVASFEYIPNKNKQLSLLYEYSTPLDDLGKELLKEYAGKSIKMKEIFLEHSKNKPFTKKNYKKILLILETEGKISCVPPRNKRKENTLADHVIIEFPEL